RCSCNIPLTMVFVFSPFETSIGVTQIGVRSKNSLPFSKKLMTSSSRFAAPSHHSVRHIQDPVCMVRDDWNVTSSLFPHPLLKSNVLRKPARPGFSFPHHPNRVSSDKSRSGTKPEFAQRKSQYSAETGRIIPPPSKSYQHRFHSQCPEYLQPFHDQELMVLELLRQILQTDSLSAVQQWLLLAGKRGNTHVDASRVTQ
uniref:Thymus, brain and testes associated n=1 Tax=Mola mola TaxID=94237 RepID=A0A3Q3WSK3_MOLML